MALINRIFPNSLSIRSSQSTTSKSDSCISTGKPLNNQKGIAKAIKNQLNSQRTGHDPGDSVGVQREPLDGSAGRIRFLLFRECDVRGRRLLFDSSAGQTNDEIPQQDLQLMKDMVFGSATLKYFGDNYRVHDFGTSPWNGHHMMLSKVFLVPPVTSSRSVASPLASSSNLTKAKNSATGTDSGFIEYGPGGSGSGLSNLETGTSPDSSQASFNSSGLAIPRIGSSQRAVSDSVIGSESAEMFKNMNRGRKTRLAIVLLISSDDGRHSNQVPKICLRELILEQFGLVEHFVQRFQFGVLRAYSSRHNFTNLMYEAIAQFGRDVDHLDTASNLMPAYLKLPPNEDQEPRSRDPAARQFMIQWESIVNETDTKLTRFFWSTLLSAVLAYHVNWLHSFVSQPSPFFDCGTRVLILSKERSLAERLLYVLSYFIRHVSTGKTPKLPPTASPSKNGTVSESRISLRRRSNSMTKSLSEVLPSPTAIPRGEAVDTSCDIVESCSSSLTGKSEPTRRGGHQLENARYLRNYYDVRFQLSPDTITKRDGRTTFANVKYSIAKNGFQQDFSFRENYGIPTAVPEEANVSSKTLGEVPAFFVGSFPECSPQQPESHHSSSSSNQSEPIPVSIPSVAGWKVKDPGTAHLAHWVYGETLDSGFQAGRIVQAFDPSSCDWLRELQRDLRAAVTRFKTVSCVVANTETWEVQVLTCVEEERFPLRIKEFWVPVTMSGQVAALVESTQLLWLLGRDPGQCLDHLDNRLQFLCHKSEDLGTLLSASIRSWNVDHINHLLGIEVQDLPLLLAACSVHNPSVAQMGGVTVL